MYFTFIRRLASGLATVIPTAALALTYTESTDFPNTVYVDVSEAQLIGTLDLGNNVVRGELHGNCIVNDCNALASWQIPDSDNQDSFTFNVSAGFQVDSITVTTSDSYGPTNFRPAVETKPSIAPYGDFRYYIPINGVTSNMLSQPLGQGVHHFSVWGSLSDAAGPYQVNYAISYSVSAVPELSTIYLFAICGTLALAFRQRSSA